MTDHLALLLTVNSLSIFAGAWVLGLGIIPSVVLVIALLIVAVIGYGRLWIIRGGFVLFIMVLLISTNVLPPPGEWKQKLSGVAHDVKSTVCCTVCAPNP